MRAGLIGWYGAEMPDCIEYHNLNHEGYGRRRTAETRERFGTALVHRQVMMMVHGREAVEGRIVRHKCDNPACFRFDHLKLGSPADNMQDRDQRGRNYLANRTHCKYGHEFTEENTMMNAGKRVCRECDRRRSRERYRRLRDERHAGLSCEPD